MKKIFIVAGFLALLVPVLAFAQSANPVLVDTVTLPFGDGAPSPASPFAQGNYLYVADNDTSDGGFLIYNIASSSAPQLVSDSGLGVYSDPLGVTVSGATAYVTAENPPLAYTFNVSNPASPARGPNIYDTNDYSGSYAKPSVEGNYLYLAALYDYQLYVVDISNPAAPKTVATVETTINGYPEFLDVAGNYAYVLSAETMQIFDISTPTSPTLAGSFTIAGTPQSFTVQGNYLYLLNWDDSNGNSSLQIYNVSNPAATSLTGSYSFGPATIYLEALAIEGSNVYIANALDTGPNGELDVINVGNPALPTFVGSATTGRVPWGISVQNGYAYVADRLSGQLQVFEVPVTPTCSISASPDPVSYESDGSESVLSWSSTNATQVYINNIGWVSSSGSTQVAPTQTTDYSCYGYSSVQGAGAWTNYTLTVTAPETPTVTIAASSTTLQAGQSTSITADFAADSNDTLAADNIDSPVGSGWGASTDPDSSKTITFSTTTPGTYIFYARATTQYYPAWTTYASVAITVLDTPWCSLSVSPASLTNGQPTTLSWNSTNAQSLTISGVGSVAADTPGSSQVYPSQTTTYTGTAVGAQDGSSTPPTAACNAPASATSTVQVACAPAYSCSGNAIQYTNAACQVSNIATCVSPSFCSSGSDSCSYPSITFNANGKLTGHLQLLPSIVLSGGTIVVDWNVSDAQSCSVTGANGDSWTGLSGNVTSSPIISQTTYTLACGGYGPNPSVSESATVEITPVFREQ